MEDVTEPPATANRRFRFDPSFNLGHILTIVTLLVAGVTAWTTLAVRISTIDTRTMDYPEIANMTRANAQQIDALKTSVADSSAALRAAVSDEAATNRQVIEAVSDVKSDVAAVSAQVKIILDTQQRPKAP